MSHAWVKGSIPGSLRQIIGEARTRPGFALSKIPLVSELIAAVFPSKRPPVLISSLPRAGSSWIGRILGASEGSLYLREPMTQSYLQRVGRQQSSFFEWGMCKDGRAYDRFAALTFRGIPRFDGTIVPYPEQWAISGRTGKRVVVKEVNPLVLERLWERFRPKIVFLVRHPVPVTRSFQALGWTGDQFRTRFSPQTLAAFEQEHTLPTQASLWEQGGAFQAMAQNLVMGFLSGIDHVVLRYEDVCKHPISEFGRIFEFCGLPFSSAVQEEIEHSSQAKVRYVPGTYDTARNSLDMKDRWKREVDPEHIEQVRRGYFAYRPIFYREESDW
jgi:hypothetical protein